MPALHVCIRAFVSSGVRQRDYDTLCDRGSLPVSFVHHCLDNLVCNPAIRGCKVIKAAVLKI